jgi:hypothetical protein
MMRGAGFAEFLMFFMAVSSFGALEYSSHNRFRLVNRGVFCNRLVDSEASLRLSFPKVQVRREDDYGV